MRYGSVCSGIEAATLAWAPLGWSPQWFSEIEPFPCRVLKHYYPDVPNLGDMLKIRENEVFKRSVIDVLVGGTPCQSFSIAGLRGGLDDDRGNLALEFCRILTAKKPRWFCWENVPGVFSSKAGRDFASIIQAFRECGYSIAWRVLDAEYWGLAQRRNRVFVVGNFGDDWRPPVAVLFEPESLFGNTPKGRKKGQVASALTKTGVGACGADDNQAQAGHLVAFGGGNTNGPIDRATACNAGGTGRIDFDSETFVVMPINTQVATRGGKMGESTGFGIGEDGDPAFTIGKNHSHAVFMAAPTPAIMYTLHGSDGTVSTATESEVATALKSRTPGGIENSSTSIVQNGPLVRRLTPLECERLQGFPDFFTAIPGAKDSPRYAAIGNSMAVPVMHWIGRRIGMADKIFNNSKIK